MNKPNIEISDNLRSLAESIHAHGGTLYIVGGYVRNAYLGLANTDMDVCGDLTYDIVLELAKELGYNANVVNKKLGTVLIRVSEDEEYEYTTFRKENYVEGGKHRPDDISFVTDIKLDASRRDFTANSLYYNILTGEVEDFYNGIEDIANHTLRCIKTPEEVFASDGLRILRLIRIANELGFAIEKNTRTCARTYAHQLRDISGERVLKELKKIVVSDFKYDSTNSQENFLDNFNYIHIYRYIFSSTFAKFKIDKHYRKNFFALPKNFRYIGFCILLLSNYFGHKYTAPAQVHWTCNTYLGNSGLKESNKNIETIISVYNVFQEIMYNRNRNYRHTLYEFYNLDSEIKKFLEAFVPDKYASLKNDVRYLRKIHVPLCYEELNVTNTDLINIAKIDKHLTSKVKMRLLVQCINEEISNSRDTLLAQAKYLNIQLRNKASS